MASAKVELVQQVECKIGEGPHWDDVTQTLLYVDIPESKVVRWNPVTDESKTTIVKGKNKNCFIG